MFALQLLLCYPYRPSLGGCSTAANIRPHHSLSQGFTVQSHQHCGNQDCAALAECLVTVFFFSSHVINSITMYFFFTIFSIILVCACMCVCVFRTYFESSCWNTKSIEHKMSLPTHTFVLSRSFSLNIT